MTGLPEKTITASDEAASYHYTGKLPERESRNRPIFDFL
jgi:hypothetical protein